MTYANGIFVAVSNSGTGNRVMTSGTFLLAPGAPPAPTAVAGDAQATITVAAGSGGAAASYTVTASPGGRTCTITVPATACSITGLTNGTAYTFTATAINGSGTSAASPASAAVTPSAPAVASSTTPGTPATPVTPLPAPSASVRAGIRATRRSAVSGQEIRLGIRATHAGTGTASSVRACLRLPANLVLTRAPGSIRSGRTVCFGLGSIAAGASRTRVAVVRAVSTRAVVRRVVGSVRSPSASPQRVIAAPVSVRIIPAPARARVAG